MRLRQVGAIAMMAAAVQAGAAAAKPDACHVLTAREVAAVQGEAFSKTKPTTHANISQCFYELPSFAKSVSVDVIRIDAREFWEERFEHGESDEGQKGRAEEGEEKHPPKAVSGVGDEAFWVGGRVAGSLYVRKGNSVLRVSVGGPGDESEKLAKTKRLAKKALPRL